MKRVITFIIVIALAIPSFAQFGKRYNHTDTDRYYGLRLGMNIATISSDDDKLDAGARTGLIIGGVYGMQLARNTPLWLETGLMYSEKGGEGHVQGDKLTYRLTYLQLPIVVKYSIDMDDDFYVQPFFGGYLALGMGGKIKNYDKQQSYAIFDQVNRFDGGLRFGCGVEYKMMYAELGYDLGIADISKDDFESTRTRSLFLNVGINF